MSAVSAVLSAAVADMDLRSSFADQFIEIRLLALRGAENAPEPLHMFAGTPAAGNDDPHRSFRDIHTFVQHLAGHQDPIFSGTEPVQKLFSFRCLCLVRDDRKTEMVADRIRGIVIRRKNDGPFLFVPDQDLPDRLKFPSAAPGDGTLTEICFHRSASLRRPRCADDKLIPSVFRTEIDRISPDEIRIDFAGGLIFRSFFLGELHRNAVRAVRRKNPSFQFIDEDFVNFRTYQGIDHGFSAVRAFGGRGKTEPIGCDRHGCGKPVDRTGKMVAFIEDDHAELRTDIFHENDG